MTDNFARFREALENALIARSENPTVPHAETDVTLGDIVYVDSDRDYVRRLAIVSAVDKEDLLVRIHLCTLHPEDATDRDLVFSGAETGYLPFLVVRGDIAAWVFAHQVWSRDWQLPEELVQSLVAFVEHGDDGADRFPNGRPLPLTFDPRRAVLKDDLRDIDAISATCDEYRAGVAQFRAVDPSLIFDLANGDYRGSPGNLLRLLQASDVASLSNLMNWLPADVFEQLLRASMQPGIDPRAAFIKRHQAVVPGRPGSLNASPAALREAFVKAALERGSCSVVELVIDSDVSQAPETVLLPEVNRPMRVQRALVGV